MWGGKHARKWGAVDDVVLRDGQANHIAVFPTAVQGAAAQFDLWRIGYAGMSLSSAIRKWSGGNSSAAYMKFLTDNTGIKSWDAVTIETLAGPKGLALMKAQAKWEAGRPYPMSDAEWAAAQNLVFPGANPVAPPDVPKPEAIASISNTQPAHWTFVAWLTSFFKRG
jgi:hypothetical protein